MILDHTGQPFRSDPAYRGANSDHHKNWRPRKRSADADLLPEKSILDARQADLFRNNGVAKGAKQTMTDHVVGSMLMPTPKPNYQALGKDPEWAREWARKAKNLFKLWANSLDASLARNQTFHSMTQLTFMQSFDAGESFAIPRWKQARDNAFCIQIIDPDRVCTPYGKTEGESMRRGIEKNSDGESIAYHIANRHPIDLSKNLLKWTRVPARTPWGRRKIIHTYDITRPEQSRGVGALVSALSEFKILDDYSQAELKAAANNALIAAFVKSDMPDELIKQIYSPTAESDAGATISSEYLDARNSMDYSMNPNSIIPLLPNEDITPFLPGRPNPSYSAFVENIFRQIGVSFGMPYEMLMKDFSKTNYSSARASMLEAYKFVKNRRAWLISSWAQPVYELWLEEQVNKGVLEAPDFYANRAAYCQCGWIASGKGWVDPVKEAQGAKLRVEYGFSTYEAECAEQGLDWEDNLEQIAHERQVMTEKGVKLSDIYQLIGDSSDTEESSNAAPR